MKFFFNKRNILQKIKKRYINEFISKNGDYTFFIKKKNFWLFYDKNKNKYLERFIRMLIVNGNKKKIKLYLSKSFYNFFYLINLKNKFFLDFFKILEIINHNFKINRNLYFISSIIKTVSNIISTSYQIQILKIKKKKKTKPTIKTIIDYIFPKNRTNLSFQWIIFYSKVFSDGLFYDRLFKSIFYTYIEGKDSYLFQKKIQTYNLLFEVLKKKKNKIYNFKLNA